MKINRKDCAPFMIATAAALWGMLVIFVKYLKAAEFDVMGIVFIRVTASFVLFFLFTFFYNKTLLKFQIKDIWCFAGSGIVSIVFFNFCYFTNIEVVSVACASVFMYSSPVWIAILSRFLFHERFTLIKVLALFLALFGCMLVSGIFNGIGTVNPCGVLLGLGSGIGYGMYTIFSRCAIDRHYHPLTITTYTFLFALIGVLPFINVHHVCITIAQTPSLLAPIVALVLLCTCTSFGLYTLGLQYMEASRAGVLATIEPLVSALAGTVLFHEPMTLMVALGIILVITAAILISLSMNDGVRHS